MLATILPPHPGNGMPPPLLRLRYHRSLVDALYWSNDGGLSNANAFLYTVVEFVGYDTGAIAPVPYRKVARGARPVPFRACSGRELWYNRLPMHRSLSQDRSRSNGLCRAFTDGVHHC